MGIVLRHKLPEKRKTVSQKTNRDLIRAETQNLSFAQVRRFLASAVNRAALYSFNSSCLSVN
jgi:hypothetical protein